VPVYALPDSNSRHCGVTMRENHSRHVSFADDRPAF
jgi:hypothetical protein